MDKNNKIQFELSCPFPINDYDRITMAHGGGGKNMNNLIEKLFLHYLDNSFTDEKHDGAVIDIECGRLAFSTDSFVVDPIFFPGGNIGELAVYGTVNDLAMCGAEPLYLSLGLIIEEGFLMKHLEQIIISIKEACEITGVKIVTGDTKVVEKGKGDGIFINTSGIGIIKKNLHISPSCVQEGDMIILSGDIGRHGIAIMRARNNLDIESSIESDCSPLHGHVSKLIEAGIEIHCLRDLTRGGLGSALNEIAAKAEIEIEINEESIIVIDEVRGICEILGFDPVYVANEGRFIAFVKKSDALKALELLKSEKHGEYASVIGEVKTKKENGIVIINTKFGAKRILDMLSGEQLPRIC